MTAEGKLTRIGQIAVPVKDIERAVGFYQDTLGMTFLFQVPGMAFFNLDGVRLLLTLPESGKAPHQASIIYYKVEDIHEAYSIFKNRGVQFLGEPHRVAKMSDHDLWMAFFNDTEGNTLALMSEVPHA